MKTRMLIFSLALTFSLGVLPAQVSAQAALSSQTRAHDGVLGPARFFPAESDIVFQLDLSALLGSPLIKALGLEGEIKVEDIKEISALLGFDPFKDIEQVTTGVTLSDNEDLPIERWLVLVTGKLKGFKPQQVIEAQKDQLAQMELKTRKIHGVSVSSAKVPIPQAGVEVMEVGLARIDDHNVLLGDLKGVTSYLAARVGKAPGLRGNPKLGKIGSLLPADATFWLAGVPDRLLGKVKAIRGKDLEGIPGVANLPELDGVLLTGRIHKDLEASAVAWTGDAESTKMLGDVCQGLVALAQFVPSDDPLVRKLLKSLTVDIQAREVKVSVTLPGDLVAQSAQDTKPKPVRLEAE